MITLINPQSSTIRRLSIAGGFTKSIVPFLDRLHSKSPLVEFDISNNKIGDAGAVALSEMLRENTTLEVLKCDNNAITLTGALCLCLELHSSPIVILPGWLSFLSLFMYNHTLRWMDHPWQDYARIYSSYPNTPQVETFILFEEKTSIFKLTVLQPNQGERKKQRLREVLLSIQRAIESNNVSFRGWFPVEEAMDPPSLLRYK